MVCSPGQVMHSTWHDLNIEKKIFILKNNAIIIITQCSNLPSLELSGEMARSLLPLLCEPLADFEVLGGWALALASIPTDLGHLPETWTIRDLRTVVVPGLLSSLYTLGRTRGLSKEGKRESGRRQFHRVPLVICPHDYIVTYPSQCPAWSPNVNNLTFFF